ncbi:MAG: FAD-dependent oxidoreductase, partial [Synechococcaceae cyanobacterium SM2_3_60]|nr:FAD-dependent oxidoreductase [Synechococcaceae cyanobacterium SM2_3_60]
RRCSGSLNLAALNCSADYAPGAVLVKDGTVYPLGDPLRQPQTLLSSLTNPLLHLSDKLNVLRLRVAAQRKTTAQILQQPDLPTLTFLRQWGFSELAIASFFRPFYGGIFLDSALETSANLFWFYFKMLASGRIVTPALGMGELTQQLAQGLPAHQIRTNYPVHALVQDGDHVTAVEGANGERLSVSRIVCATDAASARQLLPANCHSLLPLKHAL